MAKRAKKHNKGGGKLSTERAKRLSRNALILKLREQGKTFAQIGEALGVGRSWAYRMYEAVFNEKSDKVAEARDEMREREAQRLLRLLLEYCPLAEDGDYLATDMTLRIQKNLRDLLGLDAPLKTQGELNLNGNMTFRTREEMAAFVLQRVASGKPAAPGAAPPQSPPAKPST